MSNLGGLSFTAVGRPPHVPVIFIAHGVTTVPKLGRNTSVGAIAKHAAQFTILDLIAYFSAELKIVTFVVYGPRTVGRHVDAFIGVCNQIVQLPFTGLQANVGHTNKRNSVPGRGPHAPIGNLFQS